MKSVDVFIACSHRDKRLADQVLEYLKVLENKNPAFTLHIDKFLLGRNQDIQISQASIILLLISENFLTSSYFQDISYNVYDVWKQGKGDSVRVIPIVFQPITWREILHILPIGNNSIVSSTNRKVAFATLARGVQKVAEELTGTASPSSSPLSPTENMVEPADTAEKREKLESLQGSLERLYGWMRNYEDLFRLSNDREEKQRADREIEKHVERIRELLVEYIKLANQISATIPREVLRISPLLEETLYDRKQKLRIEDFLS